MRVNHKISLISITLLTTLSVAHAAPTDNAYKHIIVAPNCLVGSSSQHIQKIATLNGFSLLRVNDQGIQQLTIAKHKQRCGGFMDVTEDWQAQLKPHGKTMLLPEPTAFLQSIKPEVKTTPVKADHKQVEPAYTIKYQDQVRTTMAKMDPQRMWTNLTTLSGFRDRYANSDDGVKAAQWIKSQVEAMAAESHRQVSAYFVETGQRYKQPSLVVKLGDQEGPGIVIGAHMDTLSGTFSNKPGADDDGSGTVTVMEVAKTILSSGLNFKKPIYFVWYAAEEEGLVGSGYVVKDFKHKNIAVDAVLHLDMTGYAHKNDPTIWLIDDYTNSDLTKYLSTLIETYVKQPVDHTRCGYACSDHATWTKGGFKSAIPFEAKFGNDNPNIHSSKDTMEWLSLDHMKSYAQIGVAFAVELAEPAV